MKPHFYKVPIEHTAAFNIRHDIKPNFGKIWHYHPELELHYIIKGEGVQFIGDSVGNFNSGDMLLLGQNLPHTWHCNEEYFKTNSSKKIEAYVLHFLPDCMGKDFLGLSESYMLPKLFEKAKQGLVIEGHIKQRIASLLHQVHQSEDFERLVLFLNILKELTEINEYKTISSSYAYSTIPNIHQSRLDEVYFYTLQNFKKEITLEEIASVANMTKTSFCRHFKLVTNKTFNEFLNEVRVSHVCRALIENKFTTEVICFKYGYKNISNFYRNFKKITKMTPLEYKKKFLQIKM